MGKHPSVDKGRSISVQRLAFEPRREQASSFPLVRFHPTTAPNAVGHGAGSYHYIGLFIMPPRVRWSNEPRPRGLSAAVLTGAPTRGRGQTRSARHASL